MVRVPLPASNVRRPLKQGLRASFCRALFGAALCLPLVASAYDVALVMSQRSGSSQAFADAFVRSAVASGHRVTDAGEAGGVLDEAAIARADLVVANGEAALAAVLKAAPRPTLAVMLGREGFDVLCARYPQAELSAFTLDQPAARQLRLVRAVLPRIEHVGVLVGNATLGAQALQDSAQASGLAFSSARVGSEAELIVRLESVLRHSDAFIATPDSLLSRPALARAILLTSYRFYKPVFAFSRAYVEAGALAAVFTTPQQVADDVLGWLNGQTAKRLQLPALRDPESFEIAVNRQVARALGVFLPSEEEIRRLTAAGPDK